MSKEHAKSVPMHNKYCTSLQLLTKLVDRLENQDRANDPNTLPKTKEEPKDKVSMAQSLFAR